MSRSALKHQGAACLLAFLAAFASSVSAGMGGPRVTGRALVAVPRAEHRVFLTWRLLEQEGAAGFEVHRSAGTFNTGMGTQAQPASGDHRTDWDYEWTFKPVAWDIDGDGKAEIITPGNGSTSRISSMYHVVLCERKG